MTDESDVADDETGATSDDPIDDESAANSTGDASAADPGGDANVVRTCDRCGGEAIPVESGTLVRLECADCGNVLGLLDQEARATEDRRGGPAADRAE